MSEDQSIQTTSPKTGYTFIGHDKAHMALCCHIYIYIYIIIPTRALFLSNTTKEKNRLSYYTLPHVWDIILLVPLGFY